MLQNTKIIIIVGSALLEPDCYSILSMADRSWSGQLAMVNFIFNPLKRQCHYIFAPQFLSSLI